MSRKLIKHLIESNYMGIGDRVRKLRKKSNNNHKRKK